MRTPVMNTRHLAFALNERQRRALVQGMRARGRRRSRLDFGRNTSTGAVACFPLAAIMSASGNCILFPGPRACCAYEPTSAPSRAIPPLPRRVRRPAEARSTTSAIEFKLSAVETSYGLACEQLDLDRAGCCYDCDAHIRTQSRRPSPSAPARAGWWRGGPRPRPFCRRAPQRSTHRGVQRRRSRSRPSLSPPRLLIPCKIAARRRLRPCLQTRR